MELTSKNVEELFLKCLRPTEENSVLVHGIMFKAYLDVKDHEEDIRSMLAELPNTFMKEHGGGWSFLNGCVDKNDVQWTSEQRIVDLLFCLGQAAGMVKYLFEDRDLWKLLPGGVPYVCIDIADIQK